MNIRQFDYDNPLDELHGWEYLSHPEPSFVLKGIKTQMVKRRKGRNLVDKRTNEIVNELEVNKESADYGWHYWTIELPVYMDAEFSFFTEDADPDVGYGGDYYPALTKIIFYDSEKFQCFKFLSDILCNDHDLPIIVPHKVPYDDIESSDQIGHWLEKDTRSARSLIDLMLMGMRLFDMSYGEEKSKEKKLLKAIEAKDKLSKFKYSRP